MGLVAILTRHEVLGAIRAGLGRELGHGGEISGHECPLLCDRSSVKQQHGERNGYMAAWQQTRDASGHERRIVERGWVRGGIERDVRWTAESLAAAWCRAKKGGGANRTGASRRMTQGGWAAGGGRMAGGRTVGPRSWPGERRPVPVRHGAGPRGWSG
ncbi:hypothetical protein AcW1_005776 [Taiwanofungus camphoratus]|nr:hypothetical protein AcW1_005776 [Antrodia cinnamomea]